MDFKETHIPGCFKIVGHNLQDQRGFFQKTFNQTMFSREDLSFTVAEVFHSYSRKGVVRGLHLQGFPLYGERVVTCLSGKIFDVIVDLRPQSPRYLEHQSFELSEDSGESLFVAGGVAHGFCTNNSDALVQYIFNKEYVPELDLGVRWDSAGIEWPIQNPIISERDQSLIPAESYREQFSGNSRP